MMMDNTPRHPKISIGHLGKIFANESYIGFIRYCGKLYKRKHLSIVSKQAHNMYKQQTVEEKGDY